MAKQKSELDIPVDRLSSVDASGSRRFIHPSSVKGYFQKRRIWVHWTLLVVFLLAPWLKIGGQQLLLLDIPSRNFVFFGVTLFSHDAPILFFIFGVSALGLAFVTAIWGRIWCGWACPQTVFVDSFFRKIEELVEGNYLQRRQLEQEEMSLRKFRKKSLKWFLFIVLSVLISHSFAAYFVGSSAILEMIQSHPSENLGVFLFVMSLAAIVAFDFGWFREQFCIIMCPYGRIQSVLMDNKSMAVLYDHKRGEPRKGQVPEGQSQGDCVNCYRCVSVCPTGIDIRRGIQLECIACTACIDACDEIMDKVKKPRGLIRYSTEAEIESGVKTTRFGKRGYIYGAISLLMVAGLAITLNLRTPVYVAVVRSIESPYEVMADGSILNRFRLHLKSHSSSDGSVTVKVQDVDPEVASQIEMFLGSNPMSIKSFEDLKTPMLFKFSKDLLVGLGQREILMEFTFQDTKGENFSLERKLTLLGSEAAL